MWLTSKVWRLVRNLHIMSRNHSVHRPSICQTQFTRHSTQIHSTVFLSADIHFQTPVGVPSDHPTTTIEPNQVVHVTSEQHLRELMDVAGDKLVVVGFYANWCHSCVEVEAQLTIMARKYPNVVFVKVNVDELNELVLQHQVTKLPTFRLEKRAKNVLTLQGADYDMLSTFVKMHSTD